MPHTDISVSNLIINVLNTEQYEDLQEGGQISESELYLITDDRLDPSSTLPIVDGTASAGTSTDYARGDHVHPTDTSRAPLNSPAFTGTPTAPTATEGTDTTQIATTEFVQNSLKQGFSFEKDGYEYSGSNSFDAVLQPDELWIGTSGTATNGDPEEDIDLWNAITFNADYGARWLAYNTPINIDAYAGFNYKGNEVATLASPAFTGNPTAPTQAAGNNSTRLATTAFVQTAVSGITNNDTKTSFYGTSSTGATTQAKTTTSITDYALRTGNIVAIKFSNANTYTSNKITLNVSSTGAKDVWYQGAVTSSTNTLTWKAGQTLTFVYTGSVYICISKDDIVPEVTFVKYGTATFSEVEAAQGNGKLVIAYNQNEVQRFAPYMYYDTGGAKHKFYYIDEDGEILIWTLDSNNTWSSASSNWYVPRTRTVNSKALSSDITLDADDVGAEIAGLVYDSKTSITSLANLNTQLTTWFNAMPNMSDRFFYITASGTWSPYSSGTGIILHLQKGTATGTAIFYGRDGTTPKITMRSYASSTWNSFISMATTDDINTAIGSAILASY